MKYTKSQLMKNNGPLDKLWRSVGKEDAFCEICASLPPDKRFNYTKLDPHHIIKRGHHATRWDLKNRIWVCTRHHTLGMWSETVQDNIGGWFLNWESDNDWMGIHRPEDKEHLRKLKDVVKYGSDWTLDDLLKIMENLKNVRQNL
jgi:hypothetical protein